MLITGGVVTTEPVEVFPCAGDTGLAAADVSTDAVLTEGAMLAIAAPVPRRT